MAERTGNVKRKTKETNIEVSIDIDGKGTVDVETGVPFFNHMLELLAKHGMLDLVVQAKGDLEVDAHHTVEDVGICLGQAFRQALGEKTGIKRYGSSIMPMDEALSMVALDVSGRSHLIYDVKLPYEEVSGFDTTLVVEFLHAFVNHSAITLHVRLMSGGNVHHMIESIFKGIAKAIDEGTTLDPRIEGVPSTKGQL